MGWIFSIGLFVGSMIYHNETALIASGLFAIAGAITFSFNRFFNIIIVDDENSANKKQ